MLQLTVIMRQVRRSSKQAALFVLCVALSLTTLTAFSGFSISVSRQLLNDARRLHAGDIIISSYDPVSAPLNRAVEQLIATHGVGRTDIHRFLSVVRAPAGERSLLAALKVVEPEYPFYGEVILKSGRPFHSVLMPGRCIVEPSLLGRMNLKIGDPLKVGYTTLTIADVVTAEPDRPLTRFAFGPRIFVAAADLNALGLVEKGSRIRRVTLLKVPAGEPLNLLTGRLKQAALPHQERVETFQTARSGLKRFADNFLFFLKLVGLFILMVAGFGIQGTLTALLNEKQRSIAIMKTVGATNRYITLHFMRMVLLLGAVGTVAGIASGVAVQRALAWMLSPFLPEGLGQAVAWSGILEGIVLGFAVVLLFSFLPLQRLRHMRPMMIFRGQGEETSRRWPYYAGIGMFIFFFFGLVFWHMKELRFGLYFVGGLLGLIAAAAALTQAALWGLRKLPVDHLVARQAIRGLFRKGNAARSTVITLTASLTVIFTIYLIEKNLDATFVRAYPEDSPNAYFVDIQPHQTRAFAGAVGQTVQFYPIIRARITAINDRKIDRSHERRKRRDNFSRVFNLTYRSHLLADETLQKGRQLFRDDWQEAQVSILDTVAQMRPMKIGDTIDFKIQGVPLKARISSIRTRNSESFAPFFYFVFPEAILDKAPQTLFAALRIAPPKLERLQTRIANRFPNISTIDMSRTLSVLAGLMGRLSRIVRTFSLFSIAAGILILVSAVFATRAERITECVYYKILGADTRFVRKVFALENLLLGGLSGLLALIMAQAGAYWVCRLKLDIDYQPFWAASTAMLAATLLLVLAVGMTASRSIMGQKPVRILREQADA
jgi:putative ABC transport system permease protein